MATKKPVRNSMPGIDPDNQHQIVKEALKEWLDEQFAAFGRWSFYSILAAGFAGLVYVGLVAAGWHKGAP